MYVDDMIITGDDKQEIENLKKHLRAEFEVKDLGTLRYFLGMEVARSTQGIFSSQRKYTRFIEENWEVRLQTNKNTVRVELEAESC